MYGTLKRERNIRMRWSGEKKAHLKEIKTGY
jgi:hypothetical protein